MANVTPINITEAPAITGCLPWGELLCNWHQVSRRRSSRRVTKLTEVQNDFVGQVISANKNGVIVELTRCTRPGRW
jgi:hypothetical protein